MEVRTSDDSPIRVDYVAEAALGLPAGSGALGMTFAPGMKDLGWDRDIETDMSDLRRRWSTDVLVSLIEDHEYGFYGMDGYTAAAKNSGIAVDEFPIVDISVPREEQVEEFTDLVGGIIGHLRGGRNTVVHCRGGIGRTGTVAASVLVGLGHDADEAIEIARESRSPRMVETRPQEDYVREFAKRYRGRWSA
ncbi:MAG: fused DSP-PTPase phosphatase/NAD kinase-like protein [Rubrobacteraceae bacterium]|nr:dual specificity protein phosphatase family protein [Rubrobacter sp.]